MGLAIVYVPVWHVTLMMPLLNKRMKDKTTMIEDDLRVSTQAIYFDS